eukprot:TRINITY_DN23715_c0_g2_i1.p1 TRINITY_DN23715_c0_g2~~TRINITY_DN23715_c0_g2_i1.p1  ORF type:complete len:350 (-),score=14.22 TRINITY_DN23715_c0_g2_i1:158-1207(-)
MDISRLFSLDVLAHAGAGAFGGAAALAVFYPLEVLRTRLQIGDPVVSDVEAHRFLKTGHMLRRLVQCEGTVALYRGFVAVLIAVAATQFVYFCVFSLLKRLVSCQHVFGEMIVARDLVLGALAGTVSVLATTPLWLVNTRMKAQQTQLESQRIKRMTCSSRTIISVGLQRKHDIRPYDNVFDGLRRVYHDEGVRTLWDGTIPSLILASNPAIQWAMYELLKRWLLTLHRSLDFADARNELYAFELLTLASVAKTVATLATYPLQLAQTCLRYNYGCYRPQRGDAHSHNTAIEKRFRGMLDCLRDVYVRDGFRGLFRGLEAKLLQTVLTAAFHTLCYEKILAAIIDAAEG